VPLPPPAPASEGAERGRWSGPAPRAGHQAPEPGPHNGEPGAERGGGPGPAARAGRQAPEAGPHDGERGGGPDLSWDRRRAQGTKHLKLDPTIYDALQKERAAVGDVIYIEANSGAVRRVGRCDAYATEFDLEAEEYVPLPKARVLGLGLLLRPAFRRPVQASGVPSAAARARARSSMLRPRSKRACFRQHCLMKRRGHLSCTHMRMRRVLPRCPGAGDACRTLPEVRVRCEAHSSEPQLAWPMLRPGGAVLRWQGALCGARAPPGEAARAARAQGDVHKKKEVVQDVTLHDLDAANAKPQARPACPARGGAPPRSDWDMSARWAAALGMVQEAGFLKETPARARQPRAAAAPARSN